MLIRKSIFSHRSTPPSEKDYKKYRHKIREDFHESCAYCLMHEIYARGEESFELDHFRPKSRPEFSDLICEYTNIYYACHACNNRKWSHWPSEELQKQGSRFIDTCSELFSEHFLDDDGYWKPITRAAKYTEQKIRLNSKHNIQIRRMISELLSRFDQPPIDWDRPLKPQIEFLIKLTYR